MAAGKETPGVQYLTLIDDQTGQVWTISRAGCAVELPSSLEPLDLPLDTVHLQRASFYGIAGTGPAWELFSPATRQWQPVSPSSAVAGF
jgi:hypothetical protein